MTFTIGRVTFATKKQAAEAVRAILHGPHRDLEGNEFGLVRGLLDLHPEADMKVGPGVVRLFVAAAPLSAPGNWNCFYAERADGSVTDFSYRACLSPPTQRQNVLHAMRCDVRNQIDAFRAQHECEHVDHAIPFLALATAFLTAAGQTWDGVQVTGTIDGTWESSILDPSLRARWCLFHAQIAVLRPLTAQQNLSRGRADRWKSERGLFD